LRNRGNGCGFGASGNSTGGNPAVPSSEFINARFSARRRDTSSSSSRTYFDRIVFFNQLIMAIELRGPEPEDDGPSQVHQENSPASDERKQGSGESSEQKVRLIWILLGNGADKPSQFQSKSNE